MDGKWEYLKEIKGVLEGGICGHFPSMKHRYIYFTCFINIYKHKIELYSGE